MLKALVDAAHSPFGQQTHDGDTAEVGARCEFGGGNTAFMIVGGQPEMLFHTG